MSPWLTTAWVAIGALLLSSMLRETASGRGLAHEAERSRTWFMATTMTVLVGWPVVMAWLAFKAFFEKVKK